jgi:hypothetical protein
MAASRLLSSGRPSGSTASKVSKVPTSVPSVALAEAEMITRAKPRPCTMRVPSVLTKYWVSAWDDTDTCEVRMLG